MTAVAIFHEDGRNVGIEVDLVGGGRSDVRRGDDQRESDDVYLHGLSFVIGRPTLRVGMFDLDRYSSSSSVRKAVPATIILISSF